MQHIMLLTAAGIFTLLTSINSEAKSIDIRDCPLDSVSFFDPWAGGTFTVKRAGSNYYYLCPDGITAPSPDCGGPYGYLVLEGTYWGPNADTAVSKSAVWSVSPAVPCCDWDVESGTAKETHEDGFQWYKKNKMPSMREMPFLSIESEYGEDFGNPLIAVSCVLR